MMQKKKSSQKVCYDETKSNLDYFYMMTRNMFNFFFFYQDNIT